MLKMTRSEKSLTNLTDVIKFRTGYQTSLYNSAYLVNNVILFLSVNLMGG